MREALLNAVAHKDYSTGNPIQIKVYDDHITIWNAGQLPESLTVKKLLAPHPSIPFNPDIALTFFRAGLIEAWGRDTIKIVEECKAFNLPAPVFSNDFSGFPVMFKNTVGKSSVKSSVKGSVKGLVKSSVKSLVKSSVKSSVKIIELMTSDNTITIREIAEHLEISIRAAEKEVAKLKEENKIRRVGARKGGHWEVLNSK